MRVKPCEIWAGILILMLAGCAQSPQAKEAKSLDRGKKELEKKNYGAAILHFRNAMMAQPMDAEPYYQLGLANLGSRDFRTAAIFLRRATELNPKHTGAQLKLAAMMTNTQDKAILEEAQKRTQNVLALLPDDIDALNVLAVAELGLGKPESAEAHLEQALRKAPSDLRSAVVLAATKMTRKDVAGAEETLKQVAVRAPKLPEARVQLGTFYLAQRKTAEAEQQYRQALAIDPKHAPALLALAELQARAGQTDQAEQLYRQVSALPDKQFKATHALFLFQNGKRDQAVAEFEKLAAADRADRFLRTALVRAYLEMNKVGDAEKVLSAALQKNKRDTDALLQRSRIYISSTKYTEAEGDLNQVLHVQSTSAEAHYLLSKVAQGRGNTPIRKQELGEAVRLDPGFLPARTELAEVLTATGGAQAALQLLDGAPKEQNYKVAGVLQRNLALLALGQKPEARKGIDQVLAVARVPQALLQDAVLKLDQKDYKGAQASVEEILNQNPGDVRALNLLVRTYADQKQMPAAVQKVREYARNQPGSAALQQLLGQLLYTAGDRAGARAAFEAAKAANPGLVAPELALAELDSVEGKRETARKRLSAVVSAHPDSVPARILLAQVEISDGKPAAAAGHYRTVVAKDEKNPLALNNLAFLLLESKQPDEALKYAQKAKELAPESAAVDDTLGWTYYQKGMYPLAVTHLERAVSNEGTAVRKYHLAMAYLKAGDQKRGRQILEAALRADPKLPEAAIARQVFGMDSRAAGK